jgi:GNAT superfamily N-acetyltransferase
MMNISYQVEAFKDIRKEIGPLWEAHYKEIARHQDRIALSPDYDRYERIDEAGAMCFVTARDNGVLVGYFVCFIMPNLHFKDHVMASNDLIYLYPSHRKGYTAAKMIRYMEKVLKEKGVSRLLVNVKTANDFGILMDREGYTVIEHIYEKMFV